MAPAGIDGEFFDEIRHLVDGIGLQRVHQAGLGPEIRGVDGYARRRGRSGGLEANLPAFGRGGNRNSGTKILDYAELRVAGPVVADDVLCVDGERNILVPRLDALTVLRQQTPGLAGDDVPAPVGVVVTHEGLPDSRRIAVAFD